MEKKLRTYKIKTIEIDLWSIHDLLKHQQAPFY